MTKPDEIHAMVKEAETKLGSIDILDQQCRRAACRAHRGISPRKLGHDHRHQSVCRVPCDGCRNPWDESAKMGPRRSTASAHSLVASPFKSAYVTAKHGLAGLTKTAALEVATFGVTVNCVSPGYVWTPLVEKQIPDTMAARNMTREQVIHDVILLAQPTKQFVTSEQVAALFVFLCTDAAAQITGLQLLDRWRLDSQ